MKKNYKVLNQTTSLHSVSPVLYRLILMLTVMLCIAPLYSSGQAQPAIATRNYGQGKVTWCGMHYLVDNGYSTSTLYSNSNAMQLLRNMLSYTAGKTSGNLAVIEFASNARTSFITEAQAAGWTVTVYTSMSALNTLSAMSNYDLIALANNGNGSGQNNDASFNSNIQTYVNNGGGFFTTGWIAYQANGSGTYFNMLTAIGPFSNFGYYSWVYPGYSLTFQAPSHPILSGVGAINNTGSEFGEYPTSAVLASNSTSIATLSTANLGPTNAITTGTVSSNLCVGSNVVIPFSSSGTFTGSFSAQLSDNTGSFTSPVNLTTVSSTSSSITATLPGATTGNGYRVRVVNSNPATSGSGNGSDIFIHALPTATLTGGGTVCPGAIRPNVSIALTGTNPWSLTYSNGVTSTTVTPGSSPYVITAANPGSYSVTTVSDAYCTGTASGSASVVVQDNLAPVPDVTTLATITVECSATVTAPTATDNCAGTVTGTTTDPTSYTAQGTHTIHWIYDDGNGNTSAQNQIVVVHDNLAPVPDVATLADITGQCSAAVTAAPTATDNCAGTVTGTTTDPLSYSAQGTYTIHWIYNDGNGNTSAQNQTVVVHDNLAPVPDVATLANITGECSAAVTAAPTATDNCAGTVTGTTTDPLSYSAQGTYIIHWIYNDGNGNTTNQNQTVIVQDVTPPTAICKNISVTLSGGNASITPQMVDNGSYDNCGSVTLFSVSPSTFSCADAGNNIPVILTVKDAVGHSSVCNSVVTVVGAVPSCSISVTPSNTIYTGGVATNLYLGYGPQSATITANATGGISFTYSWSGPTGYLSCTNCKNPVFTPTMGGVYNFTCTITNNYGCVTSCNVIFCVKDVHVPGNGNNNKVYICHGGNTLSISTNAVPAHLSNHAGDYLGQCGQTCGSNVSAKMVNNNSGIIINEDFSVKAYPNPFNTGLHLFVESVTYDVVDITITDFLGRKMEVIKDQPTNRELVIGNKLSTGVYIVNVIGGNVSRQLKVIKLQ